MMWILEPPRDEKMSSAVNPKSNPDQSISFEDVSKLFSLSLSEAADILGVTPSALKRICNENGLERWPHRKYLAGKSIEEIKKEAAKEKSKTLGGISQADKQKGNVTTNVKDKSLRSASELSKSQSNAQQPGSRGIHAWRSHHVAASGLASDTSTCLDEFMYGFPSTGLSRSTNKWWGGASDSHDGISKDDPKMGAEVKPASEAGVHDTAAPLSDKKSGGMMTDSVSDTQERVSLCSIRKRALDEGQKALKLGVLKKYGVDKLGKEEKILLDRLFQTS